MNGFGERPPKYWSADASNPSEATERGGGGTSMNAISLGFVATAILISMFLIMAIFELLLRPRPPFSRPQQGDEQQPQLMHIHGKIRIFKREANPCAPDYSVVMPGQQYPTYLAQPAPLPCQREGIYWPPHDHRHHHAFASPQSLALNHS